MYPSILTKTVIITYEITYMHSQVKHYNMYTYMYIVVAICYICNMGRRDLPDMYARARRRAAPEGECGHIRQIPTAHVTYVM